jgi:hypothetical protein
MVGDKRANRAIVVGDSILMVMKCKSQNRDRKTNKQEADEFSVHQPNNLPVRREK